MREEARKGYRGAMAFEPTSPSNLSILKLRLLILSWGVEGKQTRQLAKEYITSKKYWAAILPGFDSEVKGRRESSFHGAALRVTARICAAPRAPHKLLYFPGLKLQLLIFSSTQATKDGVDRPILNSKKLDGLALPLRHVVVAFVSNKLKTTN